MKWCVIGLLFISGDPVLYSSCEDVTRGNCLDRMKVIYSIVHRNPKTGAMLRCEQRASDY